MVRAVWPIASFWQRKLKNEYHIAYINNMSYICIQLIALKMRTTTPLLTAILLIFTLKLAAQVNEVDSIYVVPDAEKKAFAITAFKADGARRNIALGKSHNINPALVGNFSDKNKEIVRFPIPDENVFFTKKDKVKAYPLYYVVQPKETLFKIARTYFNVPLETIATFNQLADNQVKIGQSLLIGWYIPSVSKPQEKETLQNQTKNTLADEHDRPATVAKTVHEQTVAIWNKNIEDNGAFFCMHATAAVGSTLIITNPMFNLSVEAKVVGNIPQGIYTNDVMLIVSPSVAKALKVLDTRFFAKITYERTL